MSFKLLYRLWECFDEWMGFEEGLPRNYFVEIGDRDIEKHGKRDKLVEIARSTVNRKTYDHTVFMYL